MQLAAFALIPLLLAAPLAPLVAEEDGWSNANSPGGGPVQGIGGSTSVLVASTWSGGTYRSFDGGLHWARIEDFPDVVEARVAFDPSDPEVGYVFGFGGVARTLDGGLTWTRVLETGVSYRLAVSPSGAVAATYRDANWGTHILLSTDRGVTWTDLGAPIPPFSSVYGLAFGPTDQTIVGMSIGDMWRTHDGGATWTTTDHTFLDLARASDGTLWGAGFGLAKSADGGATWETVSAPAGGRTLATGADGAVFLATPDGVLATRDGGATWTDLGFGDAVWGATQMTVDPADPDAVLVADEFIGVGRVSPEGYAGRTTGLQPVDMVDLAASADGGILLAASPLGIYASRDQGESWSHTGAAMGFMGVYAVAASPDGQVLMGGGQTRVFSPFVTSSRDGGLTWSTANPNLGGDGFVSGIAFDPADAMHAWASVTMDLATSKVIETRDGGRTWSMVLELPAIDIWDVAYDAALGSPILATDAGAMQLVADNAIVPRGALVDTRAVATHGARAWAGGPSGTIWSGDAGAPLAPWATAEGVALDLAVEDGDAVWAATGSALYRCELAACEERSPPADAQASLVLGSKVFAATVGGGIYVTEL